MLHSTLSSMGSPAKVTLRTRVLAVIFASLLALAHAAPTSTKWVLKHSTVTVKPKCCFFCDALTVKDCYDQPNHQRRHDMAFTVSAEVNERPPAYCVPSISCTLKGSPFKSSTSTKTEPEIYYTIAGRLGADGAPPAPVTYSRTSATISRNSVLSVKSNAAVVLARSKLSFKVSSLDVLGGASLTTALSNMQGTLRLAQLSAGRLAIQTGKLSTLDSKVLIADGSVLVGDRANITFALKRGNDRKASPKPFILTGSSLDLVYSCVKFIDHPDVFFDSAHVRLRESTLHAVNSNIRFFDTVLDLRSSLVLLENSTVWLFNTTLVQDKRVVVVKGNAPVQLNEVLGSLPRSSKPVTGLFHVSS